MILGFVGLICIVLAWIPQTLKTIKKGKTDMNTAFIVLYFVGSVSLTIYAINLNDMVFTALNGLAAAESAVNLFYKLR